MTDPARDRIVTHDQAETMITKLQAIATALTNGFSNYLLLSGGTLTGTVNGVTPSATDNSTKLATTKFVKDNVPASVGSATKPVYTDSNGKVTASNGNVGGSEQAIYMSSGELTAGGKFVPIQNNAGYHNSIFRGKSLGSSVTAAQWASIKAGTFEDMFIGDYWTINNVNWRIAAFDYWYNHGDTACTTHHVVIVPDSNLATCKMNDTNITTGAYVGSDYYTGNNSNTGKATAQTAINNAFGSGHILSHKEYLKNAVTNGYESAGAWYDSTFELMTEQMVYGCKVFGNVINGTNIPASYTISNAQLPLFRHRHDLQCNRASWWLRDVASSASFADVINYGNCNCRGASYSDGVRPAFAIYQS